jgi:peptidoglycan-associated lipoprotein
MRVIMRGQKVWIGILGIIIGLVFTASCSKSLIPPEIEATGTVGDSEFEEVAESNGGGEQGFAPEQDYPYEGDGSSEESGFVRQESLAGAGDLGGSSEGSGNFGGSDLVREENLTESGEVDGSSVYSQGNGSTGSSNPFSGNGSNGSANDQGIQEARLFSFKPTSELKDIHFQFDKYDLDSSSKSILKQNADFLKQHPSVKVEIQGHCDERGTNNYNLALGQRRAASTKRYLASLGIPENRLHVISYGEEKPFCNESSDSCWWRNRRAHFMVAE